MVKKYSQQVRREQVNQIQKLTAKAEGLSLIRRKDFVRDVKRWCLKKEVPYKKKPINIHQFLYHSAPIDKQTSIPQDQKQVKTEIHNYKLAHSNVEFVMDQLDKMSIKNSRPHDYLVEMYKSDKQMLKVRRYLTEKEERVKQKMQGKDWMSKTKRRERAKKKAEVKKAKKKAKVQAKRPQKPKMVKVNGKKKIKK